MSQLGFEIWMAVYGAWAGLVSCLQWVSIEAASASGPVAILGIMSIGLGLLFHRLSGCLTRTLVGAGVVAFAVALVGGRLIGKIPFGYATTPAGTVVATGSRLLRSAALPPGFTRAYAGRRSVFLSAPPSGQGHRYVALNRVGCTASASPPVLAAAVAEDLNAVFPIAAPGQRGKRVFDGNTFILGQLPGFGGNPVNSTGLYGHYFSLSTEPEHWLEGTAHHGVAADDAGGLWLFQYGEGPRDEGVLAQLLAYRLADKMWVRMAENVAALRPNTCGSAQAGPGPGAPAIGAGDEPRGGVPGGSRCREGDVLVPKIDSVQIRAKPADGARVLARVGRADELVCLGYERNGYVKVRGSDTAGWVRIALVGRR